MAKEIPYMASVTNIDGIIQKLRGAGTPPRFSHEFLSSTLGFRSSNDRGFIKVLRALGMVTADGAPTERYNAFKNELHGDSAMADGLRDGWADLYLADQQAHDKTATELQQTFKTITGKGDAVAQKMATTFKALTKHADFTRSSGAVSTDGSEDSPGATSNEDATPRTPDLAATGLSAMTLSHNVHVHLPTTSDVAVYTAIFRALREELLD